MTVTVHYATGDSETMATGYTVTPATFSAGDTGFTVSYGGKASAPVNLTAAVIASVSLNPDGAVFTDEVKNLYKGMPDYAFNEATGVMSVTYTEVPEGGIALPDGKQITKENSNFFGWKEAGAAASADSLLKLDGSKNLILKADWQKLNVKLQRAELLLLYVNEKGEPLDPQPKEPAADAPQKPFLVLTGTFAVDNNVQLYFHEGNEPISVFEGTTYPAKAATPFVLKYNVENIVIADASKTGKWFDIRFRTTEEIKANTKGQEVLLNAGDGFVVDMNQSVIHNGITYTFRRYTSNERGPLEALKVAFEGTLTEPPAPPAGE
jgi:hypothetical protein